MFKSKSNDIVFSNKYVNRMKHKRWFIFQNMQFELRTFFRTNYLIQTMLNVAIVVMSNWIDVWNSCKLKSTKLFNHFMQNRCKRCQIFFLKTQFWAMRRRRNEKIFAEIVKHFSNWFDRKTTISIKIAFRENFRHNHVDHSQFARNNRQMNTNETLQIRVKKRNISKKKSFEKTRKMIVKNDLQCH